MIAIYLKHAKCLINKVLSSYYIEVDNLAC